MADIAGVRLSKNQQAKLVAAAMQAARDHGYCDETRNVLETMGFDIPSETRTYTMTVEVTVPFGTDEDTVADYLEASYGGYDDGVEVETYSATLV